MKRLLSSFFIAFSMYSKIPMPKTDWSKENMKYSMCFFPLIGAVIGGVLAAFFCVVPPGGREHALFTAILVLIPVLITGGIHLDGLLDTADALSSYKPMEQKLEILKDSHAGAFAIIVGICYFVLTFGVYSEITIRTLPVIALGFILSRAFSGLAIVSFKLAKNTGLAATFSDMAVKKTVRIVMIIYILLTAAAMIMVSPAYGAAGSAAALLVFAYYRHMSYRKFGGITGDLAGFFLQICELAVALAVTCVSFIL